MKHAHLVLAAATALFASACDSGGGEYVKKMEEFAEQACACKDARVRRRSPRIRRLARQELRTRVEARRKDRRRSARDAEDGRLHGEISTK